MRLLRAFVLLYLFCASGWILIHTSFIAYVTAKLGHFPRPMIDDPNLILRDDSFYQVIGTVIDQEWFMAWFLLLCYGLALEVLCLWIIPNFVRHPLQKCLIAAGSALFLTPVFGFRMILWWFD